MDKIQSLVSQVQNVLDQIGHTFSGLQQQLGMICLSGCGGCCKSPQVEASILEALPLAFELYRSGDLSLLDMDLSNQLPCIYYQSHSPDGEKGRCGKYQTRPSICRMFGASLYRDKMGNAKVSGCKKLKKENEIDFTILGEDQSEFFMPVWRQRINAIEPELGRQLYPINLAIQKALAMIANYYWFHQEQQSPTA